jgi:hypothetical protein
MRNTQSQDDNTLQNIAQNEPQSPLNNDEFEDATERTIIDQMQERLSTIERENQQSRQEQQQTMQQILDYMRANQAVPLPQSSPVQERATPDTAISQQPAVKHYTKKQPDPDHLSDGKDPTFLSWKIGILGKFNINADHFESEYSKILYLFNRTQGDARKHLEPRVDPDHPSCFNTAEEMLQYLASIPTYVNPFKVRDARSEYNKLMMQQGQLFSDFQTRFLHLASEGNVPKSEWKGDLYDRLTSPLQNAVLVQLETASTYEAFSASCLFMDNERRRIHERVQQDKRSRASVNMYTPPTYSTQKTVRNYVALEPTEVPDSKPYQKTGPPAYSREQRQPIPEVKIAPPIQARKVTCYSCGKPGHIAPDCLERKKEADLKEIEEEEQLPEEDSQETGKEDA